MKKQIWIWALLLIFLGASLPGLTERWQTESANKTYEMIIPYEEVSDLTNSTSQLDKALMKLKKAGVTTVSFNPLTLKSMESQNILSIFTEQELYEALVFSDEKKNINLDREGYYITVPEKKEYQKMLEEAYDLEKVTFENTPFYFLPDKNDVDLSDFVGYDTSAISKMEKFGFNIILRVENSDHNKVNKRAVNELLAVKDDKISSILFIGKEALGYPNGNAIGSYAKRLHDAGYFFYSIEFTNIAGLKNVATATDYDVVRLHSLNIYSNPNVQNIDRAARAVKERNMKAIFFHIDDKKPKESIQTAVDFVNGVQDKLDDRYHSGVPSSYPQMSLPIWTLLASLAAGILFTYLAAGILKNRLLQFAAAAFMAVLVIAYFLLDRLVFLQIFALIIAVITPIYAVLSASGSRKLDGRIRSISLQYLKAAGISVIGIIIMIGLLNGNKFLNGFEQFRGVKLVYVVPLIFVTVYMCWDLVTAAVKKKGIRVLDVEVRYWHLLVFFLVAAIVGYYVIRSGNSGQASSLELSFRNWLEDVLYVRPRTKEFLIGFPAFLLGLYLSDKSKWLGRIFVIVGTIGFLSIVNTFSHIHIPLAISVLRTVYSLVFGYIIGIVLIVIVNFFWKKLRKKAVK